MFKPKYIKQGELLAKGVHKFIRYKEDVMKEGKQAEIEGLLYEFRSALKSRDETRSKELSESLTKLCEGSIPSYKSSAIRENIEVIVVTIVFALGIRAYFLQPFKIPTGSMEPTLFGIKAKQTPEEGKPFEVSIGNEAPYEEPNLLKKAWQYIVEGRNYVEVRSPVSGTLTGYKVSDMRLAVFTILSYNDGEETQRVYAPVRQLNEDLWVGGPWDLMLGETPRSPSQTVTAGQLLAKGYINTGDQVLVNKLSYHFRRPKRGEVFVFNTAHIPKIMKRNSQRSTHYIKRLCAVPGDTWEVKEPRLWINGKEAEEESIRKVWEKLPAKSPPEEPDKYRGYVGQNIPGNRTDGKLDPGKYLALGDNSANSWDGRGWGDVPEKDIVGPALMVYWPFTERWWLIR